MKKTLVALFVTGYVGIAFADQVVDTDIVVVGAGGAGFSAAVAAAEAGAKTSFCWKRIRLSAVIP